MTNTKSGQQPKKKTSKKSTKKAGPKTAKSKPAANADSTEQADPASETLDHEQADTPETANKPTHLDYLTRPADLQDVSALVAIGNQLGFFDPADDNEAVEMLTKYFSGQLAHHAWLVAEADATIVGAAYFCPEPKTVGTWNLRFLGVAEHNRGRGCGQVLLAKVEETLRMTKGRIIAETPSADALDKVRDFLVGQGYVEQARIKDFFTLGVDKVVHLKALEQAE